MAGITAAAAAGAAAASTVAAVMAWVLPMPSPAIGPG